MANFSATYSGDFTSYIAGKIFDAANMAKAEKQRANKEAERYGVEPDAKRGEFFGRALQSQFGGDLYNRTLGLFDPRKQHAETDRRSSREARYSAQFRYPDRLAKGQSTPFASPLPSDYYNRGQSSSITSASAAKRVGQPFPNVAVGAPLSSQVTPAAAKPATPMSATAKPEDMFGGKDDSVKVKDKKLGVFLAAIAESLTNTLSSINDRLDETESGVIQAKDGIAGTISKLEQSSSSLEDRLDAIIAALREQMSVAKENTDKSQIKQKERELEKGQDLSQTERIARVGEDSDEARAKAQKQDQSQEPYGGYNDMGIGYERGGIVSGPKSGYMLDEPLHGTEMIIPLDNNFTRNLPSAVDGSMPSMNERGTTSVNVTNNVNAVSKMAGPRFLPSILKADPANIKQVDEEIENIGEAMKGLVQVPGVIMMGQTASALADIPAASMVSNEIKLTGKAISDKFGVRNTITDSIIRKTRTEKAEKQRRQAVTAPSSSTSDKGTQKSSGSSFNIFNPLTWFNNWGRGNNNNNNNRGGGGGGGYRAMSGAGSGGGTYIRTNAPAGQGGGLSLPGTGRVMAPSGARYNTQGGTVQKIFGMTVPGSYKQSGYSKDDIQRFNRTSKTQYLEQYDAVLRPSALSPETKKLYKKYGITSEPAHRVRNRKGSNSNVAPQQGAVTGANNKRLNEAIRNAQDIGNMTGTRGLMDSTAGSASKAQTRYDVLREAMRKAGMSGADQNMNIYGKPHGNQSSLGTPSGKLQSIALLNMASQHNALSRMGGGGANLDPIVINNVQQASAQQEDIPHSPISTVGDAGISAFYPSPFA